MRLQYPAKVEPIINLGDAETVSADRTQGHRPDFARVRKPLVATGFTVKPLEPSVTEAPPALAWKGYQADRAPGHRPRLPGLSVLAIDPVLVGQPTALSWSPTFADRAPGRPPIRPEAYARPTEPSLAEAPPALSWQGRYADRAPGHRPRLPGHYDRPLEPSVTEAPPALSWKGIYADRAPGRPPVRPEAYARPVEPSLTEAPPELSWRSVYPDFARRRRPRPHAGAVGSPAPVADSGGSVPVIVSTGSAVLDPAGTSIGVAAPAGAAGQLLVAFLHVNGVQAVSTPSGWDAVTSVADTFNGGKLWCYGRVANGTSTDDIAFTLTSTIATLGVARISGQASSNPVNVSATAAPAAGTTQLSPDVTTTTGNCLILRDIGLTRALITVTTPGTESDGDALAQKWNIAGTTGVGSQQTLAHSAQAAAGAAGTATFGLSSSRESSEIVLAIAPGAESVPGLDGWWRQAAEPRRQRQPLRVAAWQERPPEPSLTELPPALAWQGRYADRAPGPRPRLPGLNVLGVDPVLVGQPVALSWSPTFADFARKRPPHPRGGQERPPEPSVTEAPPALSWRGVYPDRAPGHGPRLSGLSVKPVEPSITEAPPALSWLGTFADFARKHKPRLSGLSVLGANPNDFVEPGVIYVDYWWRQPSEPRRARPPLRGAGESLTSPRTDGEVILLDKWWRQVSEPRRLIAPRLQGGHSRPGEPTQTVELLIWMPRLPHLLRGRKQERAATGAMVPLRELPDHLSWLQQQQSPIVRSRRGHLFHSGQWTLLASSGSTFIFPWWYYRTQQVIDAGD